MAFRTVVLPEPFGPQIAVSWPGRAVKLTASTTDLPASRTERLETSITVSPTG